MITREDCVEIGKIVKTHNLQGEVVIATEGDLIEKYADEPVFLQLDGALVPFFISDESVSVRNHTSYIVKFDYVDTVEQAEHLLGCMVLLERGLLEADEIDGFDYNVFELVDFEVCDELSGEAGKVTDVADYAGNVVLTLSIFGKEILLPLSDIYVHEVDFEKRLLLTRIPSDLVSLN